MPDVTSSIFVDCDLAHHSPVHSSTLRGKPSARSIANAACTSYATRRAVAKNEYSDCVDSELLSSPARPRLRVSLHARMDALHSCGAPKYDSDRDAKTFTYCSSIPPRALSDVFPGFAASHTFSAARGASAFAPTAI